MPGGHQGLGRRRRAPAQKDSAGARRSRSGAAACVCLQARGAAEGRGLRLAGVPALLEARPHGDQAQVEARSAEALVLARASGDDGAVVEALRARKDACPGPSGRAERSALAAEMLLQGMGEFPIQKFAQGESMHVTVTEIESALEAASPEPVDVDPQLWSDWLDFLQGAASSGGLLVQ